MLDFIRIACAVPAVRVGDTAKNAEDICAYIEKADGERVDIVLFPELALTGYSCQDLFFQDTLWTGVQQGIRKIADCTKNHPGVTAVEMCIRDRSYTLFTEPAVEFSMGRMPYWHSP